MLCVACASERRAESQQGSERKFDSRSRPGPAAARRGGRWASTGPPRTPAAASATRRTAGFLPEKGEQRERAEKGRVPARTGRGRPPHGGQ